MGFSVGFVLFPNLTQLDFTGPLQVLHRLPGAETHIAAKTLDLVPTDCGLSLKPTVSFADCPPLDMICVPGGFGVAEALGDQQTLDFIAERGAQAQYVTSVCTGAFLLGAAGLLKGKKAATHWAYTSLLPLVGAEHEPGRVVWDGNTVTGGGVTAGIDFALSIVGEIAGETTAKSLQMAIEYDPSPGLDAGHPSRAPDVAERMARFYETPLETMRAALSK